MSTAAEAVARLAEDGPKEMPASPAPSQWRLPRAQVLARCIPAIELLGATKLLCVDKTGTLTSKRMQLRRLWMEGAAYACVQAQQARRAGVASCLLTLPRRLGGEKGGYNYIATSAKDAYRLFRMVRSTDSPIFTEATIMETNRLHRGRLIDHIQLVVRDLKASENFYKAVMSVLDIPVFSTESDYFVADELVVSSSNSVTAMGKLTGRHHLAFQAKDRATVDAFYNAALAYGGQDNGPPGVRAYHPGYYAAFVLDPDGNNIEAVYQGVAKRSAPSVTLDF